MAQPSIIRELTEREKADAHAAALLHECAKQIHFQAHPAPAPQFTDGCYAAIKIINKELNKLGRKGFGE